MFALSRIVIVVWLAVLVTPSVSRLAGRPVSVVVGGQGDFQYEYDPSRLIAPPGASMMNCHGLSLDKDDNIYLTYENDNQGSELHCMIRWNPDGMGVGRFVGEGKDLCTGTPHGLTIAAEHTTAQDVEQYFYHANNEQKLTKTFLNGTIVWQTSGKVDPSASNTSYRPTWLGVPPVGDYIYLCDGYGSNNVYLINRFTGIYANKTWGGRGNRTQHSKFATNHGCVYDPVFDQIVVADRENGRLEYFDYHGTTFDFSHSVDLRKEGSKLGPDTRPCILRRRKAEQGEKLLAAIPDLTGPVAIVDETNEVLSVINVSALLGHLGHLHPHDAQVLPNGDLIVGTWNPGRLSYWKRLPQVTSESQ